MRQGKEYRRNRDSSGDYCCRGNGAELKACDSVVQVARESKRRLADPSTPETCDDCACRPQNCVVSILHTSSSSYEESYLNESRKAGHYFTYAVPRYVRSKCGPETQKSTSAMLPRPHVGSCSGEEPSIDTGHRAIPKARASVRMPSANGRGA